MRAGVPNKKTQAAKENTKAFFARMLNDAAEQQTWDRFLASESEEIALKAFLRAVEYKRGKPIQPVARGEDTGEFFVVSDGPRPEANQPQERIQ